MLSLRRFIPYPDLLSIPNIRWLIISRFFADLFFNSTTIVVFQHQRGLNFTQMFLMESIISATVWLADIPTGAWADRFGYRRLILVGRLLNLVGFVVFVFAYGFWLFAFSNVLAGLAIACFSGCESAMVYKSLPSQEKESVAPRAYTLLYTTSNAGLFAGLLIGSFIGAYSPTLAVEVSCIPAVIALLTALRLRTEPKGDASETHIKIVSLRGLLRSAVTIIRAQPALVGLSFFDTAAFAFVNAIFWYNQPYFTRVGISVVWFGLIMATAMGLKILVGLRLPYMQSRLGVRFTLILSCLLPGIAYILLAVAHAPLFIMVCITLIVILPAWRAPLVQSELNRLILDEARATTLSSLSFLGTIAGIALNPLIGYVGDLGLAITGISIGAGLIALCMVIPFVVRTQIRTQK